MTLAILRILAALVWSAVVAPFPPLVGLLTLGNRRLFARAAMAGERAWFAGLRAILGLRVEVEGAPPPRPCIICPNHVSYLDVLVVGSIVRTLFVSRADVANWPLIGLLVRAGGTLFIRRDRARDTRRVGGKMALHLDDGCRIVVFLEGRTSRIDEVQPFRSSLLQAAVDRAVPCVPVAIRYSVRGEADPGELIAWVDNSPFAPHAWRLAQARGLRATVRFLPAREGADRKVLARQLEDDVRAAVSGERSPDR